ncbi:MAG: hypothetical protein E7028_01025 [Planctomycetaceae bacterium]|nr:hypothetical protein [Planctomycetaceae bacterium]
MNIKKVFIVVLFSLACFPLCALAENDDEGQKYYEKGMRYWNRMQASEGELRDAYHTKASTQFEMGAEKDDPDCMFMAGECKMAFGFQMWGYADEYFLKAEDDFKDAEKRYAELLISAEDNGESIEEIEAKIKKAAQRAKDAKVAWKNVNNDRLLKAGITTPLF